jgi:hypothetical protein
MKDKLKEMKKWQSQQFRRYELNAARRVLSNAAFFLLVFTLLMAFAMSTIKL